MVNMKHLAFVLFSLGDLVLFAIGIQCRDENNDPVDWYTLYKIPKVEHTNNLVKKGVGYTYITSKNYTSWTFSTYSINDTKSVVGNTLAPFYKNKSNIAYVLYNDQPPNKPSKPEEGHTKGVILADTNFGLWIIHSVPHFPQLESKYTYPSTGIRKGQSFLCISLDMKNLNNVGKQLQYNQPQIYLSYIPTILQTKINEIVQAASGIVVQQPPWYSRMFINSIKGIQFISFAKSKKFGKDLYEDWVAPTFQSDLLVETWLNGEGKLPSDCSKQFKVHNVENVTMVVANVTFKSTQDHSKWAVSQNSSWICIGDINRMEHQKHRGGGTVCLNNTKLAADYRDCVKGIEKCHK